MMDETRTAPRILFTSPYIPLPKSGVREDNMDYFYYRNTFAQKVFQIRQMHSWHPLHYLAQNLPVYAVVLENPYFEAFVREIEQGAYNVLCLTFTVMLSDRLLNMIRWVKHNHPEIEIIIGGYGTSIFNEKIGIEQLIARYTDHICHGEGLQFMKEYLKQRWNLDAAVPYTQELVPAKNSFFRTHIPLYRQLNFFASLGCTHGCEFCATSAQYKRKKLKILQGESLYRIIRLQAEKYPEVNSAVIYDENFLDDREAVLEFMKCMENDRDLQDRPFFLTVFSSVRSIEKYRIDELVRAGIGTIFIGVESFDHKIYSRMNKRGVADVGELFGKLHEAGINTLASIVIGWDEQDRNSLSCDLEKFAELEPTFYQVVPLHPLPGTPLWDRMKKEGRIIPGYKYEHDGVYRNSFFYKNFTQDEIQERVFEVYQELVARGGPWPFRLFTNLLKGYVNFRNSESEILRKRSRGYRKLLMQIAPLAAASGLLFTGKGFRKKWHGMMRLFLKEERMNAVYSLVKGIFILPLLVLVNLIGHLRFALLPHGDQPDSLRKVYDNSRTLDRG